MHEDNGVTKLGGKGELTLEESNQARIQALNAIGVGINGVNDVLVLMMMERLLGSVAADEVKEQHQRWLANQLDVMESQVLEQQRKQALTLPGQQRRR